MSLDLESEFVKLPERDEEPDGNGFLPGVTVHVDLSSTIKSCPKVPYILFLEMTTRSSRK
jgi:hypothetical protein